MSGDEWNNALLFYLTRLARALGQAEASSSEKSVVFATKRTKPSISGFLLSPEKSPLLVKHSRRQYEALLCDFSVDG